MNTSSDARNPVELLAEEFLNRKRRGEQPTLREYLERYPDLAVEIRDLFPALLMVEDLGESSGGTTGSLAAEKGAALGVRLERLGDYRILREIGRGGMGVVYEAEQESLGRRVALKVLSAGSLLDPKQVRRFEREAKAAARLHHTNIVPVFGVGQQDGHHYFVMQFIAGAGLDVVLDDLRRLRQPKSETRSAAEPAAARQVDGLSAAAVARSLITGQFDADRSPIADGSVTEPCDDVAPTPAATANGPPADSSSAILPGSSELSSSSDHDRQFYRSIAQIGIQVAEALEYANRQGILHRDVKPSNLLLDNHGNVWVADFGLAKTAEADDLTHTGDILGTIRYMAPERFSGHCDARSDVYSLGLTLYELVALRPAYEASDRHTLIDRVLHEEPERLKKRAPGVPRDMETIIAKATARDPAVRYATASALAEDLRRFVEDRPIRARRISPAERLMRWCRRNKVLAASLGVAAVALVTTLVLALFYADRQARHAAEQAEANKRITGLANEVEKESSALRSERSHLKTALAESNSRLAMLHLERGRAAFEKGQIGVGLLWTVESLRTAVAAGDEAGQRVALTNLSAWRRQLVEVRCVFSRGVMRGASFSPDGKTILAGVGNTLRLCDAATGRPVGRPIEHSSRVTSAAFSPDGRLILSGSHDKTARLWDATTGQPIGYPLEHSEAVTAVAFSPDGKTFLTGSGHETARLWDADTGRPVGQPMKHSGFVTSVAFSPDGRLILTGSTDKTARLWDADTGRPFGQPLEHSSYVSSAAFSPDGQTVLTGCSDQTARLWDAATGQPIGQPLEHSGAVMSVAFSPDGKTVLTASGDKTARLWDAVTGQPMGRPIVHQGVVRFATFSPDGRSILTAAEGEAWLWDCEAGQTPGRLLEFESDRTATAFSSDGKTLLTACDNGTIWLWDAASGQRRGQSMKLAPGITALALSRDGKTMLTGSYDQTARLWDADTGRPRGTPMKHPAVVTSVAFSPDDKTILTRGSDGKARLWDADTGQPIGQPLEHSSYVSSAAFHPDGQTVLTGSHDKTVRLWDAATGRPLGQPMEHPASVRSVAFSPDGRTILTGCDDRIARQWDVATGRVTGPLLKQSGEVSSVAYSPDGQTIVTAAIDGRAQAWDAVTGQPIGPPMLHARDGSGAERVAFSPDGRFLLTINRGTGRLWDAPAPLPADLPRLAAWVETATGLALDEQGSIRVLDGDAWWERRRRLEQLGGSPPDPTPRQDPILFGPHPEARGDALAARGLWDQAEAAYTEAARARPLNAAWIGNSVWDSLTRFYLSRSRAERAAGALDAAVSRWPDSLGLRHWQCYALLAAGDRIGWERAIAGLLDRFREPMNDDDRNTVAWLCALGPYTVADPEAPVRLAEAAVDEAPRFKADYLNTLGAALYRAGRFDEAIRRLEEAIQGHEGGQGLPADWSLLAMAHHRLGHRELARRWLERVRDHQPSGSREQFLRELEIRLLLSEAEALILYDASFPADPFAH
jgi:WD40 repeat protein/serine/threonine protein kinase/tetratricopeptide (TPR) repeat protein